MRRITPPMVEIPLYTGGFADRDILNRSEFAKRLTRLLDCVDEPLVIALDGDWGSGKSFFLRCWTGAHINEFAGKSQIIYFDAFAKDFLKDPLIGITEALEERILAIKGEEGSLRRMKSALVKLARPALRVAISTMTAGISEFASPVVAAAAEEFAKSITDGVDKIWENEKERTAAIEEFREGLKSITTLDENKRNLIFIVDELDRCRPDYAIDLLEIIKHFFEVPNVHFVLGVNQEELEGNIRHRYGEGTNSRAYLAKYINLRMTLPDGTKPIGHHERAASLQYIRTQADNMEIDRDFAEITYNMALLTNKDISLRDASRLLSIIAINMLQKDDMKKLSYGYKYGLAFLICLKLFHSYEYRRILSGKFDAEALLKLIDRPSTYTGDGFKNLEEVDEAIKHFTSHERYDGPIAPYLFPRTSNPNPVEFVSLAHHYLETIGDFTT